MERFMCQHPLENVFTYSEDETGGLVVMFRLEVGNYLHEDHTHEVTMCRLSCSLHEQHVTDAAAEGF